MTASIEHMDFKSGAKNGDMIYICGRLAYVGNTSMQVRIDSYVESMEDGMRHMITTAFFVMVAIDDEAKPAATPETIEKLDGNIQSTFSVLKCV